RPFSKILTARAAASSAEIPPAARPSGPAPRAEAGARARPRDSCRAPPRVAPRASTTAPPSPPPASAARRAFRRGGSIALVRFRSWRVEQLHGRGGGIRGEGERLVRRHVQQRNHRQPDETALRQARRRAQLAELTRADKQRRRQFRRDLARAA